MGRIRKSDVHVKETSDPNTGTVFLYAINFVDTSGFDEKKRKNEKDLQNASTKKYVYYKRSGALSNVKNIYIVEKKQIDKKNK